MPVTLLEIPFPVGHETEFRKAFGALGDEAIEKAGVDRLHTFIFGNRAFLLVDSSHDDPLRHLQEDAATKGWFRSWVGHSTLQPDQWQDHVFPLVEPRQAPRTRGREVLR